MLPYLKTLLISIKHVPFVKYSLATVGIAAAAAAVGSFNIEGAEKIPVISLLLILGFTVLIFLLSNVTKSPNKWLRVAGLILIYTAVIIASLSSLMLFSAVFFNIPKSISELTSDKDVTIKEKYSPSRSNTTTFTKSDSLVKGATTIKETFLQQENEDGDNKTTVNQNEGQPTRPVDTSSQKNISIEQKNKRGDNHATINN